MPVELGLGLVGIGKPWGHVPKPIPSESEALALLEFAFELGVRYFDTAPSYGDGVSERRLGRFLQSLPASQRKLVVAATKMGEHWDSAAGAPYADHSYDALRRSLDISLERLGSVEVLQLHKTTPAVLASGDVQSAWEYAKAFGIGKLGPSVSDPESARAAIANRGYNVIQLPYNRSNPGPFGDCIDQAALRGIWVAVNRPFAMGAMIHEGAAARDAFGFILERRFHGVILTGTTTREHLRQNWDAFQATRAGA